MDDDKAKTAISVVERVSGIDGAPRTPTVDNIRRAGLDPQTVEMIIKGFLTISSESQTTALHDDPILAIGLGFLLACEYAYQSRAELQDEINS